MYKNIFKTRDMILTIINQEYEIYYTNIRKQVAYNYIQKFHILNHLNGDLPIQYVLGNHNINIDKFKVEDQFHYIISIRPREHKCDYYSKSIIDAITGLYNRNYLEEIRETICYSKFKNISLILIDIDNLKNINDNYGHLEGDKAIEIVGNSIKNNIRAEDIGIRYGGDEFIIILFNKDTKTANKIVNRIKKEINKRNLIEDTNIKISAGIAGTDELNDLDYLIKVADKDLYEEKRAKKKHKNIEVKNLEGLTENIERVRNKLNKQILNDYKNINRQEILKLSRELDELIVKHLKIIQEK